MPLHLQSITNEVTEELFGSIMEKVSLSESAHLQRQGKYMLLAKDIFDEKSKKKLANTYLH